MTILDHFFKVKFGKGPIFCTIQKFGPRFCIVQKFGPTFCIVGPRFCTYKMSDRFIVYFWVEKTPRA